MAPLPLPLPEWPRILRPESSSSSHVLAVLAERTRASLSRIASRHERQPQPTEDTSFPPLAAVVAVVAALVGLVVLYVSWRAINHFFGPFTRGIKFEEAVRDTCSPRRRYRRWRRRRDAERKLSEESAASAASGQAAVEMAESRERADWLRRVAGEPVPPRSADHYHAHHDRHQEPHQRRTSQIDLPPAPEPRRKSSAAIITEVAIAAPTTEKEFC